MLKYVRCLSSMPTVQVAVYMKKMLGVFYIDAKLCMNISVTATIEKG